MRGTSIKVALCVLGTLAWQDAARVSGTTKESTGTACADQRKEARNGASFANVPLHFERNLGQHPTAVAFAARGPGFGVFLTEAGATLTFDASTTLRMSFAGANRAPAIAGVEQLPSTVNYLRGRDPAAWRTNIPTYAKVLYRSLYPGVDLAYYGNQQPLEYDFIVSPHADPSRIVLAFDDVASVRIDEASGDLLLRASGGGVELRQQKPTIYQQAGDGDGRQPIEGRYVLRGPKLAGFEVGPYDATRTLIIDPVLAFSSYLGGSGFDTGQRVAVDATGNVYLTGTTASPDFPRTTGPARASALDEVFVAKVARDGSALVYATYLGGTGNDRARDIAVDAAGHAFVTGFTDSTDFPVHNAVQPGPGGLGDAFVAELSVAGDALIYATYLGGSRRDSGEGIALDASGSAYVTGSTISTNFPSTPGVFQPQLAGIDPSLDAFITKLAPNGTSIVYSTFLGGGEADAGTAIAVNARGEAFVTGVTGSGDFPRVRPFQPNAFLGIVDAFVSKVSANGSALIYSSNLGGDETDVGQDIAVDALDRAVVGGFTTSPDFPLARPVQRALAGSADGFVTIISAAGNSVSFSTYLGGTGRDEVTSIGVNPNPGFIGPGGGAAAASIVQVAGRTFSTDFPTVRPIQPASGGNLDAFVAKLDVLNRRIIYSTYLGGEADDDATGIAVDAAGSAYVIGTTQSSLFPVVHALQPHNAGGADAFFAKITDFTVCLQDDQSGSSLQIDASSGGYQLGGCGSAGGGGGSASQAQRLGTGRVISTGSLVVLIDQGVLAVYNSRQNTGFARIVSNQQQVVTINDSNVTNNSCACP